MPTELLAFGHPDEFPEDVERLFAQGEGDGISLGSDWYRILMLAVIQPGEVVRFHVLRQEGRAVAALPLVSKASRIPLHRKAESLANYYTTLYAPLLDPRLDAQDLVPLLRGIRRAEPLLASLRLQPMDPQSRSYAVLRRALRLAGFMPFDFYCFGNWFLSAPKDWPLFLAGRNSKMRSNIKRMEKKLVQEGGTVEIVVDRADRERAIEAYQRVYDASWKQAEPYPHFMPNLIAQAFDRGWMRLGIVWLEAKPIAAQVWIVANGKADIYKVAYDEAFKEYSPGTVLTARLMQHVLEQDRVREVDYLIGDDPYKKNWMSDRRERWGVVAYNPYTPGGAVGALREGMGRLAKRVWLGLKPQREKPPAP
jgi:CelD/BcsL family acetyltransferase involved in cellulose biosynthesis